MRRTVPYWLALALTACGSKKAEVRFEFSGQAPLAAIYDDTRVLSAKCGACGQTLSSRLEKCACGRTLKWPDSVPCGFCRATGACDPCDQGGAAGHCRHCAGGGTLRGSACFACDGEGACVACGGSNRCDACGGSARVPPVGWRPSRPAPRRPSTEIPLAGVDRSVLWPGQSVRLAQSGEVFRIEPGRVVSYGTSTGAFAPSVSGSYVARGKDGQAAFEVLDAEIRTNVPESQPLGPSTRLTCEFVISPPARSLPRRWEGRMNGSSLSLVRGERVELTPGKAGALTLEPFLDVPNLGPIPGPKSLQYKVRELRIALASSLCGEGQPLRATVSGDFLATTSIEWTAVCGAVTVQSVSEGLQGEIVPPFAGVYRLTARAGACEAPSVEFRVMGARFASSEGKPVDFVRVSLMETAFDEKGRLRSDFVSRDTGRFSIELQGGEPDQFELRTIRRDGVELNPPVLYRGSKASDLLIVGSATDDEARALGLGDDATGDPTLLGEVGGRLEVLFRGQKIASIPVTVEHLLELPVRVVTYGADRRAIELRLQAANRIWSPCGIRFVLESVQVAERPAGLLFVNGTPTGVDSQGHPSEVTAVINGQTLSFPLVRPSRNEPDAVIRGVTSLLLDRLGENWGCDVISRLFLTDPTAAVLRLRSGSEIRIDSARTRDTAFMIEPLRADPSRGCEIAASSGAWTREEIAVLLGVARAGRGIQIHVVPGLRTAGSHPVYKAYPDWAFPEAVGNSIVISARAMDASSRWPTALARALADLIAARAPSEPNSLFSDPLPEEDRVDVNRRIGRGSADLFLEKAGRLREAGR